MLFHLVALKDVCLRVFEKDSGNYESCTCLRVGNELEIVKMLAASETDQQPPITRGYEHPKEIGETKEYDGLFTLKRIE